MSTSTRAAHGLKANSPTAKAASQSQALWRFLHHPNVTPAHLIEPLHQAAREGCASSASPFVLIMHDWCKLDFKRHASKKDVLSVTHKHDVGYDLTASLAVEAEQGAVLAPVAMHLRTKQKLHSTCAAPPKKSARHLNQLAPTMDEIQQLELGRTPVHIIDREADSLGHFRTWTEREHLFLVRCDDRRVTCAGESVLLSEINQKLDQEVRFKKAGLARYRGKKVRREVAEVSVVLSGAHKTRVQGKQREISGAALTLRAVFVRLVDKEGWILAEWMLLTNVPSAAASAATIGLWYYYRWRIESYFKLLKSAGHELEYWQQTTGKAILCRLLIVSLACVFVWRLHRDKSEEAAALRALLMKLSGRQTKYGVESTASGLLAGWQILLAMSSVLQSGLTLNDISRLAQAHAPPGSFV